jgi:hypothetical protein
LLPLAKSFLLFLFRFFYFEFRLSIPYGGCQLASGKKSSIHFGNTRRSLIKLSESDGGDTFRMPLKENWSFSKTNFDSGFRGIFSRRKLSLFSLRRISHIPPANPS